MHVQFKVWNSASMCALIHLYAPALYAMIINCKESSERLASARSVISPVLIMAHLWAILLRGRSQLPEQARFRGIVNAPLAIQMNTFCESII